jgi:hypothetical protein
MSTRKATVQPECTNEECRRLKRLKASAAIELRRMYRTKAVVIAVHDAAEHDAAFVVADALAVILSQLDAHIAALDQHVTEVLSAGGLDTFDVEARL